MTNANQETLAFPYYAGLNTQVLSFNHSHLISDNKWQEVSAGLPLSIEHGDLDFAVYKDAVLVNVKEGHQAGIYSLQGETLKWHKIAQPIPNHKIGRLVSAAGRLYVGGSIYIGEFDPETGIYFDISQQLTHKGLYSLQIFTSEYGLLAKGSSKKDRKGQDWLAMYHPEQGRWQFIDTPEAGIITDVKTDKQGHLWMELKNHPKARIFRALRTQEGDYQAFVAMAAEQGRISVANDGAVYFIREKAKYTQIQAVYQFVNLDDGFKWQQVHQDQGYAAPGYALGKQAILINSSRFKQYVIQGSKKWMLPNTDFYNGANYRSVVLGDVIFAIKSTKIDQQPVMEGVKALRINTDDQLAYDANLNIYGTYLTDQVAQAVGVEVLSSGKIIVAINTEQGGRLMFLSADGKTLLAQRDLVGDILDIDSDPQGQFFAVTHGDHVTIFNDPVQLEGELRLVDQVVGSIQLSGVVKAVAIANDGRFAALVNKTIEVYDLRPLTLVYQRPFNFSYVTDVEIDAQGDNFYLTSFNNQTLPSAKPVQSARIAAYSIASGPQSSANWVQFGAKGDQLANDIADTRLYRVEFGGDGMLYTLGESAGTKTQFRWNGVVLNGNSPLRVIDYHNDLWNTGSAHVAYHARINPQNGEILAAQLTMGRLNNGKSNTFSVGRITEQVFGDIAADVSGLNIVTGEVKAHLANRAHSLTVNQQPVSPYNGGDATLMVLSENLSQRATWTTLDKSADFDGFITSVAIDEGKIVLLTDVEQGETFVSEDAMIVHNKVGNTVHLAIIDMQQQYAKGDPEL